MSVIATPEVYAQEHKKAFRVAFDFLSAHFPPEDTIDWWAKTASDAADESEKMGGDKLLTGLMIGLFEYLEDECKRRRPEQ